VAFFENFQCVSCGHLLAYLQDQGQLGSLEGAGGELWRSPNHTSDGRLYRLCDDYTVQNVCNWAVPASDPSRFCISCRLNRMIPDLSQRGFKEAWYRLEVAKRRLIYTLMTLGLPIVNKADDPEKGLAFEFLADVPGGERKLTGHDNGVITINVAETDDAEREKRRLELHEPYRTLVGHFRHEVAHYYWDRLIQNSPRLDDFRRLFGDEREDYRQALDRHYVQGAPPNWPDRFVTAYASSHAWEDWAETWAHYLHMTDTLETAAACGLSLQPSQPNEPSLTTAPESIPPSSFDRLIHDWFALTYLLNNFNRSLGLADSFPFGLSSPVIDKLRLVHEIIAGA
jgi:hypothetical protein